MTRTTPCMPNLMRRWLWAAAAALLVLTGCATKGGGSDTDGQGVGSQLDAAAPGLDRCEKRGSKLCATATDAAEALLLLSRKQSITAADLCPGTVDGQGVGSQLDAAAPLQQRLAKGFNVLNETLARTQCVQACGGTAECCKCCAQPTTDPAGLTAQCRRTAPPR